MRKLIVLTFVTLDGVMQAPGGPEEDTDGGFVHGGWVVPYFDERLGELMAEQMTRPRDLLLGRRTYEIFAAYWPAHESDWPGINRATKYVASTTRTEPLWENTVFLAGDAADAIRRLKGEDGPELQVHGSSGLLQTLFEHDLVDELWLKVFPVALGAGKRLFGPGIAPAAFELTHTDATPSGVLVASYQRKGDVTTGTFVG
jgi:dihydrofolate reductase